MHKTSFLGWVTLSVMALITLVPFSLVVLGAMSSDENISRLDFSQASFSALGKNFASVLTGPSGLGTAILNTVILCVVLIIFQVPSTILAAYAFAFFDFRGKRVLYVTLLAAYLIPAVATVIPLFFLMSALGLKGTPLAIVLPYLLFSPYALVLLRQRFEALPTNLLDQARVDGLGPWSFLVRIAVPLTGSFIALVSLITFVSMWNAFLWPGLIARTTFPTTIVAMSNLQGQYDSNWQLVLAAAVLGLIPCITAFFVAGNTLVKTSLHESTN